ncbi:MAG TPA: hypothetical protein VKT72_16950 [Candidatus Baltobacteraceae bacterium]|nr:hypothetical protein [Candidatus Baltobacteraceae bacterium]
MAASLASCASPHSGVVPLNDALRTTMSTPQAVPGNTPHALPGNTPQALPGETLGCDLTFEADQANCTIAININVPPIGNPTTPENLLPGFHPADLIDRYKLPAQNSGGTVAIVDAYDDPAAEADLAVYRTAYGLPACTSTNGCFNKVNEQGQTAPYPVANAGWDQEISLDLDMVSAVCPNCKILLVEANSPSFDDLGASVDTAAKIGANAISNSYYGPEWSGETAYDFHYLHKGVAITVSAGDQNSPFYPAVSSNVTAVGGTSLSGSDGAWTESAWKYTAKGCSLYERKPAWGSTKCKNVRSMNDVAAVADPQTGVSMYDSTAGGWLVAGGTSVGAPIVAAAYALSGNPQGPAYSYKHRSAFNDIAPAGYDWATGLGTPDGGAGL